MAYRLSLVDGALEISNPARHPLFHVDNLEDDVRAIKRLTEAQLLLSLGNGSSAAVRELAEQQRDHNTKTEALARKHLEQAKRLADIAHHERERRAFERLKDDEKSRAEAREHYRQEGLRMFSLWIRGGRDSRCENWGIDSQMRAEGMGAECAAAYIDRQKRKPPPRPIEDIRSEVQRLVGNMEHWRSEVLAFLEWYNGTDDVWYKIDEIPRRIIDDIALATANEIRHFIDEPVDRVVSYCRGWGVVDLAVARLASTLHKDRLAEALTILNERERDHRSAVTRRHSLDAEVRALQHSVDEAASNWKRLSAVADDQERSVPSYRLPALPRILFSSPDRPYVAALVALGVFMFTVGPLVALGAFMFTATLGLIVSCACAAGAAMAYLLLVDRSFGWRVVWPRRVIEENRAVACAARRTAEHARRAWEAAEANAQQQSSALSNRIRDTDAEVASTQSAVAAAKAALATAASESLRVRLQDRELVKRLIADAIPCALVNTDGVYFEPRALPDAVLEELADDIPVRLGDPGTDLTAEFGLRLP